MVREGVAAGFHPLRADYVTDKHELVRSGVGFRRTIAQPLRTIGPTVLP